MPQAQEPFIETHLLTYILIFQEYHSPAQPAAIVYYEERFAFGRWPITSPCRIESNQISLAS